MSADRDLDDALGAIERSVLSGLPPLLDMLLDSASIARPGTDAADLADSLRATAEQVDALARLVGAAADLPQPSPPLRIPA